MLAIGTSTQPKTISTRILCLSIFLTGALAVWSYSAALTSFLTVEKYEYPVRSLEVRYFCSYIIIGIAFGKQHKKLRTDYYCYDDTSVLNFLCCFQSLLFGVH